MSSRLFLVCIPFLLLLDGCHAVHLSSVTATAVSSVSSTSAISRIHSDPLYRQAEACCRQHRYLQAAHLLQRLANQPGLSLEAVDFVRRQRNICLRDAGQKVFTTEDTEEYRGKTLSLSSAVRAVAPAEADCGPRALRLVCQQFGIEVSLSKLRQLAGTTAQGTSMAGLATAAKAVGMKAEGVQTGRDALPELDMPALAYVNGNHFLAVLSLQGSGDEGIATIHDPNRAAEETISTATAMSSWRPIRSTIRPS